METAGRGFVPNSEKQRDLARAHMVRLITPKRREPLPEKNFLTLGPKEIESRQVSREEAVGLLERLAMRGMPKDLSSQIIALMEKMRKKHGFAFIMVNHEPKTIGGMEESKSVTVNFITALGSITVEPRLGARNGEAQFELSGERIFKGVNSPETLSSFEIH